jgi:hypothetical protein
MRIKKINGVYWVFIGLSAMRIPKEQVKGYNCVVEHF